MARPVRAFGKQFAGLARSGDALYLALVVAVGVLTRLTYVWVVEFAGDEASVAKIAVAFLGGQTLPLAGIGSSVGITNPPAFVYLMAIPLAISRSPAFATGFVGLLGVGTAVLCYRFCREHFDRRTAQVAALLFAAAPWAVIFSRKIQSQDVIPFFTLLLMGSLFGLAGRRDGLSLVGVAVWLSVVVQIHFEGIIVIPIALLVVALCLRRQHPRWLLAALAVTAVLWMPYVIFQFTDG